MNNLSIRLLNTCHKYQDGIEQKFLPIISTPPIIYLFDLKDDEYIPEKWDTNNHFDIYERCCNCFETTYYLTQRAKEKVDISYIRGYFVNYDPIDPEKKRKTNLHFFDICQHCYSTKVKDEYSFLCDTIIRLYGFEFYVTEENSVNIEEYNTVYKNAPKKPVKEQTFFYFK